MALYAYADPPYPGQARRHYRHDPSGIPACEVDHAALIARLCDEYPDGWALSSSSPALRLILPFCPSDVRIGSWVKPFAIYKPYVNPAYAWEPVIWRGGRKRTRDEATGRDWVSANITLRKGTHGAKPETFILWVFFTLLGVQPGDRVDDLYPGSGVVTQMINRLNSEVLA